MPAPTHARTHALIHATTSPRHHARARLLGAGVGSRPDPGGCALGMRRVTVAWQWLAGASWQGELSSGVGTVSADNKMTRWQNDKTTRRQDDKRSQSVEAATTSNRQATTGNDRQRQAATSSDSNDYWPGSGPARRRIDALWLSLASVMGLMACLLLLDRFLSSFNVLQCASMRFNVLESAGCDGCWPGLMKQWPALFCA